MAAKKGNKTALGNDGGRPTKYKEEYNEQAYKLCLLGATDEDLALFFEVAESTINEWKLQYKEFSESIKAGKTKSDIEVAKELYRGAMDRVVIEQQAIKIKEVFWKDGNKCEKEKIEIVELEKVIPADFRNQQFWLKNRKSDKWRDKTEVEQSGELGIVFKEEKTYETKPKADKGS